MGIADDYKEMTEIVAKMDERRQRQVESQLAGINRLLGILMSVHRIVSEPVSNYQRSFMERHAQLRDLVVTQLADPPAVRFAIEEDGPRYYVDTVSVNDDEAGDIIVLLKPVQ